MYVIRLPDWKLFFLFLNENICCGYSKEPSRWDGSFEHPKHMFKLMDKKITTILSIYFWLHWSYVWYSIFVAHLDITKRNSAPLFRILRRNNRITYSHTVYILNTLQIELCKKFKPRSDCSITTFKVPHDNVKWTRSRCIVNILQILQKTVFKINSIFLHKIFIACIFHINCNLVIPINCNLSFVMILHVHWRHGTKFWQRLCSIYVFFIKRSFIMILHWLYM